MSDESTNVEGFINKAETIVLANVANEQFGVSELAEEMNMSRSNLLRKIKKQTKLSASQFIRQVRLNKGMDLLRKTSWTVSEVSYKVGFGSTSYFIKCFREYYGHPPGEVGKREVIYEGPKGVSKKQPTVAIALVVMVLLIFSAYYLYKGSVTENKIDLEKSIAVLPFKNESSDSTNLYFVNGLMESALSNLQKIEDLRVISRTSVEKYRNTTKAIPEISEELNVNYIIEGSGQKVGDQVLLNIQLIEAKTDKHIWAEQYSRELVDIFSMQNEVAQKIADAIEAIVTPAELEQIEKKPTESLEAYDFYLKALDPFFSRSKEGLEEAISLFEQAIEHDPQFALAHANIAISYYFLDIFREDKQYSDLINNHADKALLYDSKLAESLMAKAFYYMHNKEFRLAVPHLEKALEYNPNSAGVVQMLADLYARMIPNTNKYLEYALKGIQLDIAANDSTTKSYIYLHLSNALIQTGFVDEAITYINKSLDFNPNNYFSPYVRVYILYAKDRNIEKTKQLLIKEWSKDTTRLDILQEVAKIYYFKEEYDSSFYYYKKFVDARINFGLDIYPQEDAKISIVYKKMGMEQKARELFNEYVDYCENDESIYKSASMAVRHIYEGNYEVAIEQLKEFATQDNFQYWIVLFLEDDPIMKPLKSHPEFEGIIKKIEDRF